MSQEDIRLCGRFFDEVCNKRQLDTADQLFSANHIYHDPSSPWVGPGPGGMKELIGAYHRAVNDAHWDVHVMMKAGDVVITRWTGRGTHTGDLLGIPPTGKTVKVDGIWMHCVSSGRIVESWNCWDMLGMLQQLGVIPTRGAMRSAA